MIQNIFSINEAQSYKTYKIYSVILQSNASAFKTQVSIFPKRKQSSLLQKSHFFCNFTVFRVLYDWYPVSWWSGMMRKIIRGNLNVKWNQYITKFIPPIGSSRDRSHFRSFFLFCSFTFSFSFRYYFSIPIEE